MAGPTSEVLMTLIEFSGKVDYQYCSISDHNGNEYDSKKSKTLVIILFYIWISLSHTDLHPEFLKSKID